MTSAGQADVSDMEGAHGNLWEPGSVLFLDLGCG